MKPPFPGLALIALAVVTTVAALTIAFLVPPLAALVVWPVIMFVPGWALMTVLRPPMAATGLIGLAIVISVVLSTHLAWWLGLATGGYTRTTVFGVTAMLLIPVIAWITRHPAVPSGALRRAVSGVRRDPIPWAIAASSGWFVGFVLSLGLWRSTPTGVVAGGWNWSDLGVHLSIVQSLNAGNFPPDVPYFAGVPLTYHWFSDFHAAIIASSSQIFGVHAMVAQSAVLAAALALLVHGLTRQLLRGPHAGRAAAIAAVLVVFGGGLGWMRLVGDLALERGDILSLVTNFSYDNQWYDTLGEVHWPYFNIPSVMGTGLLAHRATAAGLPIVVAGILLLVAGLPPRWRGAAGVRDRWPLILLAGGLGALLAPFHFFFFPAFLGLAAIYVVAAGRLVDRAAPRNAALFLAPYLLAVPFALAAIQQSRGSGALKLVAGWETAPFEDGLAAVAFYYATNLGVPFLLALIALLVPGTRWRWFLAGWIAALFVAPNVVQVSVVAFDMNKLFQVMWIAVAILAAWLVRRWPTPAIATVLILSVPSPLLVAAWTATSNDQVLSTTDLVAAEWVAQQTPPRSVFITDGWLNSLVDPAGRLRVSTYGPYVANLGYSPDERERQVRAIYCEGSTDAAVTIMQELDAQYVIDAGRPPECLLPTAFEEDDRFVEVYSGPGPRIWQLRGAAPD
ncbi:MAG: hypothetical protein M3406_11630 [Chloroflexota bacterium]|nr:hypothetical protein [Chloroflexota bacterium]